MNLVLTKKIPDCPKMKEPTFVTSFMYGPLCTKTRSYKEPYFQVIVVTL